eukprot:759328-Hanusia_phi.AAC.3
MFRRRPRKREAKGAEASARLPCRIIRDKTDGAEGPAAAQCCSGEFRVPRYGPSSDPGPGSALAGAQWSDRTARGRAAESSVTRWL